jgi:hypothetical protein
MRPIRRTMPQNPEDFDFAAPSEFGVEHTTLLGEVPDVDTSSFLSPQSTSHYSNDYVSGAGYAGERGRRVAPHMPLDFYEQ